MVGFGSFRVGSRFDAPRLDSMPMNCSVDPHRSASGRDMGPSVVPAVSYLEFSRGIHERVMRDRVPIAGSLELTNRCNFDCAHCFIVTGPGPDSREMNTAQVKRVLDQLAEAGTLWLLITGGDPLIRKDFAEVYLHAKRLGLITTVFTNGAMVTDEIADLFAEYRPFTVEITLYGHSRDAYETMTQKRGSFRRAREGIDRLLRRDVPLELKGVATTLNSHEMDDMKDWVESLGLEFRFDQVINPRKDGGHAPLAVRLSPGAVLKMDVSDQERVDAWVEFMCKFDRRKNTDDRLYHCGAGMVNFNISAYGRLTMCGMSERPGYDLKTGSFLEGWERALPMERAKPYSREYACRTCDRISLCGNCPAMAEMENGDPETTVDYLHSIAAARENAFSRGEVSRIPTRADPPTPKAPELQPMHSLPGL